MPHQPARTDPAAVRRWFPFRSADPGARIRLFAFPQAGASAAAFLPWARELPAEVEVCAAESPGRGGRSAEPPHRRAAPLVRDLREVTAGLLDLPYVLCGHSMGAVLAFELARALAAAGAPRPAALVVSGMVAPARWPVRPPVHDLDVPELLAAAESFLGLPPEITEDPEVLELLLPPLRADLELTETYRYRPGPPQDRPPLDCTVLACAGEQDRSAPAAAMAGWGEVTGGEFRREVFPGSHFFLFERPEMLAAVGRLLTAAIR